LSEILAQGRFNQLLVDPAGGLVAYLFCAWQFLDLHILNVATLPRFRRRGVARRLMAMAEEHASDMGGESLTLEVRECNVAAIALYDSLGYLRVGRRAHYYPDGEDAVAMTKKIRS
jgi:ribosomal protein S18 acetylase RimI-like enzyme